MKQILECNGLRRNVCYYFNLMLCRVTEKKITLIIVTIIHSQYAGLMQVDATFLTTLFYTLHTAMTFYLEVTFSHKLNSYFTELNIIKANI